MKISVLICTRNRPADIAWALPYVLQNTYSDYEVIVVDQSDDGETGQVVARHLDTHGNLRYVASATRGLSRARNLAIDLAVGEVIAFTDDDCEVPPDWVSTIAGLFTADPGLDMVYGQVHMPEDLPEGDWAVPCLYIGRRRQLRNGDILGMGANMAFRRDLAARIGRYDTLLGAGGVFSGGEDFDFNYRAQRIGAKVVVEPDLVCVHKAFRRLSQWQEVLYSYGMGDAAFYAKHARCADLWALRALCGKLAVSAVRALRARLRGRRAPGRDPVGFF